MIYCNNGDHAGSEPPKGVIIFLSLYPVKSIEYRLDSPPLPSSSNQEATTIQAGSHVDINTTSKQGIRPAIGGRSADTPVIRKPSKELAKRLEAGDAARRAQIRAEEQRAAECEAIQNADNLHARIAYLERSLKKLTTDFNKLKKGS